MHKEPVNPGLGQLYSDYKRNAKRDGRAFCLTLAEFQRLTSSNCHYCGRAPHRKRYGRWGKTPYVYNGIDRVDNTAPYHIRNVISSCWDCNRWKHTMTVSDFLAHVMRIAHRFLGTPTVS